MKTIFTVLSLLIFSFSFSQSKKIETYIRELHNSQFQIIHPQKENFKVKSKAAMKLVKFGKASSAKLIEALSDSNKTIMAHWALCQIFFKHVSFAGPKTYSAGNKDLNKYYLGEEHGQGLIITEEQVSEKDFKLYVTEHDRAEIIKYWHQKTANKAGSGIVK